MHVNVNGQEFVVADDERVPFWRRVVNGDWEPDAFTVLSRFLDRTRAFVDVGAWVGPLTLYAAGVAKHCYAIEPDPIARVALERNAALNDEHRERITVLPAALSDFRGSGRLGNVTSGGGDSMSSLLFSSSEVGWSVDCTTLDELIGSLDIDDVGLIKIDVEGSEVEVLAGSENYVKLKRPPLFVSVHPKFWPNPLERAQALFDALGEYEHLEAPDGRPVSPRSLVEPPRLRGLYELVAY